MTGANVLEQLSDQLVSLADGAAGARRPGRRAPHAVRPPGPFSHRNGSSSPRTASIGTAACSCETGRARTAPAEYAGADAATDLAVLRVPGLAAAPIERGGRTSTGAVRPGLGTHVERRARGERRDRVGRRWPTADRARGRTIEQVVRADVRLHPLGAGGPLVDGAGRAGGDRDRRQPARHAAVHPRRHRLAGGRVDHGARIARGAATWASARSRCACPNALRGGRAQEVGLLVVATAAGQPGCAGGPHARRHHPGASTASRRGSRRNCSSLLTGDRSGKPRAVDIIRGGEPRGCRSRPV